MRGLNKRVKFLRQAETLDEFGQRTGQPRILAEVWAKVEPLDGREFFAALQGQSDISTRIRCHYDSRLKDLTAQDQAVYGDRIFDIRSAIDVGERHVELEIMCTEHNKQE